MDESEIGLFGKLLQSAGQLEFFVVFPYELRSENPCRNKVFHILLPTNLNFECYYVI